MSGLIANLIIFCLCLSTFLALRWAIPTTPNWLKPFLHNALLAAIALAVIATAGDILMLSFDNGIITNLLPTFALHLGVVAFGHAIWTLYRKEA